MELLQSMKVFAKLAELGSFTKVADAMQTGRPQVTLSIQDLEAKLGVRLFQRTTRKVKLTTEGERFYERVRDILQGVADATSMFDSTGSTLQGRLRIDIPAAFSQQKFINRLKRFSDSYPGLELTVGVTDRAVDLVAEGVDCALRIGDLPDSSMVAHCIGTAIMATCAAPAYLKASGEPKSFTDLDSHQGVVFLSGQNRKRLPWRFLVDGRERLHVGQGTISVSETDTYVQCGVAGFGIIQAPGIVLEEQLAAKALVEILKDLRPNPRPVSVLFPSRSYVAPQVRAFVSWLREHFVELNPKWLEASAASLK